MEKQFPQVNFLSIYYSLDLIGMKQCSNFHFPRLRESSRDELFEKAKGEILDEVINLSQISAKDWEQLLYDKLWEKLSIYCFENIYLAASNSNSPG